MWNLREHDRKKRTIEFTTRSKASAGKRVCWVRRIRFRDALINQERNRSHCNLTAGITLGFLGVESQFGLPIESELAAPRVRCCDCPPLIR